MKTNDRQERVPLDYFLLVFVLAIPLWLIGGDKLPIPVNLPLSALTTFCPLIAAALLSYRRFGLPAVQGLLKKSVDYKKIHNRLWYIPTLLLAPLLYLLSYALMRWAGMPLPELQTPLWLAPLFFVVYFIADTGEELGWTGYAIDPMQKRWGALNASLLLGLIWAMWHSIAFIQTDNPANWILWQCLKTVAMRVIIVWIYNNTGKSVFAAILYHTTDNVSWSLFPYYGSQYNPMVTGLITSITAAIIVYGWGAKTLSRYRYARAAQTA